MAAGDWWDEFVDEVEDIFTDGGEDDDYNTGEGILYGIAAVATGGLSVAAEAGGDAAYDSEADSNVWPTQVNHEDPKVQAWVAWCSAATWIMSNTPTTLPGAIPAKLPFGVLVDGKFIDGGQVSELWWAPDGDEKPTRLAKVKTADSHPALQWYFTLLEAVNSYYGVNVGAILRLDNARLNDMIGQIVVAFCAVLNPYLGAAVGLAYAAGQAGGGGKEGTEAMVAEFNVFVAEFGGKRYADAAWTEAEDKEGKQAFEMGTEVGVYAAETAGSAGKTGKLDTGAMASAAGKWAAGKATDYLKGKGATMAAAAARNVDWGKAAEDAAGELAGEKTVEATAEELAASAAAEAVAAVGDSAVSAATKFLTNGAILVGFVAFVDQYGAEGVVPILYRYFTEACGLNYDQTLDAFEVVGNALEAARNAGTVDTSARDSAGPPNMPAPTAAKSGSASAPNMPPPDGKSHASGRKATAREYVNGRLVR